MTKFAAAAIALLVVAVPSIASADCIEDVRRVALDKKDKKNVAQLKSFNCRNGQDTFRVEFHRFSEPAASLIVSKRGTEVMRRTFGTPRLVENDVFKSYADLLQRFGQNVQLTGNLRGQSTFFVGPVTDADRGNADDTMPGRTIRQILGSGGSSSTDYPAHEEIAALRKKVIPDGMRFYYQATCRDEFRDDAPRDVECKNFDHDTVKATFWRPMRRDDLDNYARNIGEYNRALMRFKADVKASKKKAFTQDPMRPSDLSAKLSFFKYLAGDTWPADFLIISGGQTDSCGEDEIAGVDGWSLGHSGRLIHLDAVLVENTSKRPLRIGELFGRRVDEPRLRRAVEPAASGGDSMGDMSETLAPGQRLLIPARIELVSDETDTLPSVKQSKALFDRHGLNGFSGGKAGHGFPSLPDYSYGPEIAITGLQVNDARVDLAPRRVHNFIDLSVTPEIGSCPFLLSWSDRSHEWTDHGKVLHRAPNREREYTDTRTVEGFAARFRLEEREAELAHIDHAELAVALVDGRTLTLTPGNTALAARDGNFLRLYWGDAIEIAFALPQGVSEDDVIESTFRVTGYYERYSALMARNQMPAAGSRRAAAVLRGETPRSSALACPIPARPSLRLPIGTL